MPSTSCCLQWRSATDGLPTLRTPNSAVVLGSRPSRLADAELRLAGCLLYRNGELAETGAGGIMAGSPVNALAWLANRSVAGGLALSTGTVVVVCSMTKAVPAAPGDIAQVSIARPRHRDRRARPMKPLAVREEEPDDDRGRRGPPWRRDRSRSGPAGGGAVAVLPGARSLPSGPIWTSPPRTPSNTRRCVSG